MEIYEVLKEEERIRNKADQMFSPLGGAMELLPLCNMDCRMCYVRKSRAEMEAEGRMLSCDEWLDIARQAKEQGVLFLLLTGGEPLMYPEFKRLYLRLSEMGFVLTINTNGTLIDEEWADFFAARPCRRLSISVYGRDDATYAALCNHPGGFTQVMRAAELLKERQVPFRFTSSLTGDNADELKELFEIADRFGVQLKTAAYMFPAVRRGITPEQQVRLDPETAAQMVFRSHQLMQSQMDLDLRIWQTLKRLDEKPRFWKLKGYTCHAGRSGFWINWKGEMLPCGMMNSPTVSLLNHTFAEAWSDIVQETQKITYSEECIHCRIQNVCSACPANIYAETGAYHVKPAYICRHTKELVRCQLRYLTRENPEQYQALAESIGV